MKVNSVKNRLYIMDTEPLRDPAAADAVYASLPEIRKEKADSCRNPEDRLRALAAGALLVKLCDEEGLSPLMEDLTVNAYGKPFFSGAPEVCFSLSHAGTRVILAVSDRSVGCDIETVRAKMDIDAISRRFFTPSEHQMLQDIADPDIRRACFFRLWTLKESFVKETGLGLYLPLNSFDLSLKEDGAVSVRLTEKLPTEFAPEVSENVSFFEYPMEDGYFCSCCVRGSLQENTCLFRIFLV